MRATQNITRLHLEAFTQNEAATWSQDDPLLIIYGFILA